MTTAEIQQQVFPSHGDRSPPAPASQVLNNPRLAARILAHGEEINMQKFAVTSKGMQRSVAWVSEKSPEMRERWEDPIGDKIRHRRFRETEIPYSHFNRDAVGVTKNHIVMRNLAINWKKVLGFGVLALVLLPFTILGMGKLIIDSVDWKKEVIQCYDRSSKKKTGAIDSLKRDQFFTDEDSIYVYDKDKNIKVYDPKSLECRFTLKAPIGKIETTQDAIITSSSKGIEIRDKKTGSLRSHIPATEDIVKRGRDRDRHIEFYIAGDRIVIPGSEQTYSLAVDGGPLEVHDIVLQKDIYIQENHFADKTPEGLLRIHHPLGTIVKEIQLPEGARNVILLADGVVFIKREGSQDIVCKQKFDSIETEVVHRGSYLNDMKAVGNFLFIRSASSYNGPIRVIHHKAKEEVPIQTDLGYTGDLSASTRTQSVLMHNVLWDLS